MSYNHLCYVNTRFIKLFPFVHSCHVSCYSHPVQWPQEELQRHRNRTLRHSVSVFLVFWIYQNRLLIKKMSGKWQLEWPRIQLHR